METLEEIWDRIKKQFEEDAKKPPTFVLYGSKKTIDEFNKALNESMEAYIKENYSKK